MGDLVRLDLESLKYMATRYHKKPLEFSMEILNREWAPWQVKTLLASADARRISRTAGHGVGKTWVAGAIALHRLCTLPEAQTVITSATGTQLTTRLWPTVAKLAQGSKVPNWFEYTNNTVRIKGLSSNWIRAQPWNRSNSESFAGLHVKSPALIVDEASAVEDMVFEAFEGSMQHPNSFSMMIGNPLYRHGALWDSANGKRHMYDYDSISCLDSTYTSPEWIQEMRDAYGEDSDVFRTRILGQFPTSESEGFIPESLVRAAVGRKVMSMPGEPKIAGLDVARYGKDASCLVIRQGNEIIHIKYWRQKDSMDMAEEAAQILQKYDVALCCVDANGLGGPVADRLRKLYQDKVIDVMLNSGGGDKTYHDKRSVLWGKTKDWLNYGSIPNDKDLIAAGCSLLYTFDKDGRIWLERKEMAAARGVASPDPWDALAYSWGATVTPSVRKGTNSGNTSNRVSIAW